MNNRNFLERISLFGYKSIRELNDLRLAEGLNLLIGANGSGKSNFIRFFEMLGHMVDPNKGLQHYVAWGGMAPAFLFRGARVTPELRAHLHFGAYEYRFHLHATADHALFFSHESVIFEGAEFPPTGGEKVSGHRESMLTGRQTNQVALWVADAIREWREYHFHDTSPYSPVMSSCNSSDAEALHGNGSNIAAVLRHMRQTYPDHYARVEETVRLVAPFFGAFVLKEFSPGQIQLNWKERYSDQIYNPVQLSDGTIRFICLATLLLQPNPPATIIVDEPELGLHPYAIKLLASLMHEASRHTQIIVATQSSLLVDEFRPEDIIVANSRDGETTLERLDSATLAAWLEEYTLGQLWEKNYLGGQP